MRLRELFKELRAELISHDVESPELTVRIFLKSILKLEDHDLISNPERKISNDEYEVLGQKLHFP